MYTLIKQGPGDCLIALTLCLYCSSTRSSQKSLLIASDRSGGSRDVSHTL